MQNENRRTFVRTVAMTAVSASRILGANDRVNVGVVGLGGRGRAHMQGWSKVPGSNITALCDVDQAALERGDYAAARVCFVGASEISRNGTRISG